MRMIALATLAAATFGALAVPGGAASRTTGFFTVEGRYDEVANCLMKELPPGLKGWPSVSPPPRRDAIVNVFDQSRSVTPVRVFHVVGNGAGVVTVSVEKSSNLALARTVVKRCD